MKRWMTRLLILVAISAAAYGAYHLIQQIPKSPQEIATTVVVKGDVVVRSFTRGELRAVRSATLVAPNLFGTVQVTRLAPLGSFAHAKDLVVEFDDSEVLGRLEEKRLEIAQIDEQIKKAEADLAVRNNQDQVDLLTAKFDVRRAELEVGRNELLSAIDAKKNVLTLDESKRKLNQLESDIKSRLEQAQAQLAVLRANREKGALQLTREEERLSQVKLLAPMSGLVALRQNRNQAFFFPGMVIPDIREGDQLQPGMQMADVLDLSELEIVARVGEIDRANLHEGQDASIALDAIPGKAVHGRIKTMSGQATANVFSSDPAKKFDVVFSVDMRELLAAVGASKDTIAKILATAEENRRHAGPEVTSSSEPVESMKYSKQDLENAKLPAPPEEEGQLGVLLRPGLLADVQIVVEKIPNALHIPAQAIFDKEGHAVVYVKAGAGFEPRLVKTAKRTESVMVIAGGLQPGEIVALADPTVKRDPNARKQKADSAMGALPGGRN